MSNLTQNLDSCAVLVPNDYAAAFDSSGHVQSSKDDLAVIVLSSDAPTWAGNAVVPQYNASIGDSIVVVGYGQTSCNSLWSSFSNWAGDRYFGANTLADTYWDDLICIDKTKDDPNAALTSFGDSGGPLLETAATRDLVGVTSLGVCHESLFQTSSSASGLACYTLTGNHRDWIDSSLSANCGGTGGASGTGGTTATGGMSSGGTSALSGGAPATGGRTGIGGQLGTGGSQNGTGGNAATGGSVYATGGISAICTPGTTRCSGGKLYTCNPQGTSESNVACGSGTCTSSAACSPCGAVSQACCSGSSCTSGLCVNGTCYAEPPSTLMNRFASLCDNAHWQSSGTCYPGASASSGCCTDSNKQTTNGSGCSTQTCWKLEDAPKAFWTYDSQPSFGAFFQVSHCFEGSPAANRYSSTGCSTYGVPTQIGYIASTSIGIWNTPIYLCQITTNAGASEHMIVLDPGECSSGILVSATPFGYVVP